MTKNFNYNETIEEAISGSIEELSFNNNFGTYKCDKCKLRHYIAKPRCQECNGILTPLPVKEEKRKSEHYNIPDNCRTRLLLQPKVEDIRITPQFSLKTFDELLHREEKTMPMQTAESSPFRCKEEKKEKTMTEPKLEIKLWTEENPDKSAILMFQILKQAKAFYELEGIKGKEYADITVYMDAHSALDLGEVWLRGEHKHFDKRITNATYENIEEAEDYKIKLLRTLKLLTNDVYDTKSLVPYEEYEFHNGDDNYRATREFLMLNEGSEFPYITRRNNKEVDNYREVVKKVYIWETEDNITYRIG